MIILLSNWDHIIIFVVTHVCKFSSSHPALSHHTCANNIYRNTCLQVHSSSYKFTSSTGLSDMWTTCRNTPLRESSFDSSLSTIYSPQRPHVKYKVIHSYANHNIAKLFQWWNSKIKVEMRGSRQEVKGQAGQFEVWDLEQRRTYIIVMLWSPVFHRARNLFQQWKLCMPTCNTMYCTRMLHCKL